MKLKELCCSRHSSSAPFEGIKSPAGLPVSWTFWKRQCRQVQMASHGTSLDLTELALISLIKMEPDASRDSYVQRDSILPGNRALLS